LLEGTLNYDGLLTDFPEFVKMAGGKKTMGTLAVCWWFILE
jgi:hypothetical protein